MTSANNITIIIVILFICNGFNSI